MASLRVGAVLLTLAPILWVWGDPATMPPPLLLAVVGAVLFGNSRIRLPSCATTR